MGRVRVSRRVGTSAAVVCAVLALAACGSASSGSAASSSTPSSAPPPAATPSPADGVTPSADASTSSPAAPTTTATKTPTAKPVARPVLVLESDGLGYVVGDASIRHLPFGTDASTVLTAVGTALGGSLTKNDLPECGQGPRSGAVRAGFSVLLDGSKFVGWTDQGAKGRTLTTADGLGVGSTLREIKAARPGTTRTDGSVGTEFVDGDGFGGILDGGGLSSRATLVYAGETCFFR